VVLERFLAALASRSSSFQHLIFHNAKHNVMKAGTKLLAFEPPPQLTSDHFELLAPGRGNVPAPPRCSNRRGFSSGLRENSVTASAMDGEARSRYRPRRLVKQKYGSLDRFYMETDFSKGHLSRILRGTSSPTISTVEKSASLGLQLEDLFEAKTFG
jgi:hypothetical protein